MLTADDLTLLEFEAAAPRAIGAKEEAIRSAFGISPVRYYQRLNLIIDTPEAMKINPTLVPSASLAGEEFCMSEVMAPSLSSQRDAVTWTPVLD